MSFPEYTQKTEDHQASLILVRQIGSKTKSKLFRRIFDRVSRYTCVRVQEQQRTIFVRYKSKYDTDNNKWGDFQAHRKVIGMICVGKVEEEEDLNALRRSYDYQKTQYQSTLYDSRLFVLGVDSEGNIMSRQSSVDSSRDSRESTPILTLKNVPERIAEREKENSAPNRGKNDVEDVPVKEGLMMRSIVKTDCINDPLRTPDNELDDKISIGAMSKTPTSPISPEAKLKDFLPEVMTRRIGTESTDKGTQIWFYKNLELCIDLEDKLEDFITSLFWVLESKRLDRSYEKMEKLPLLMAPFEKKDMVGMDIEGRNYKKRCLGRLRKHLADLCLLAGLPGEALLHYQTAADTLKTCNDWLWLAASLEGLCSASVAVHYPIVQKSPFTRNLSFSVKRGSSAMNEARIKTDGGMFSNGLDLATESRVKNALPSEEIIEKYKEALVHYKKFKPAAIIAMEASVKACKVLVLQKKNLQAAEFLQNVIYANLQLSEDEKIQRYSTLALLYNQIGFHRKAAFFKRVAAMQCVTPTNQKPGWLQCYNLLLQGLDGFKIPLDVRKFPDGHRSGWPVIQLRVLQELVYAARRIGNPAVVIRHLSFLLHTMCEHLSEQERKELSTLVETYTSKCQASQEPIPLDNGPVLPPVPLSRLPSVRSFKPLNLPPHLRPTKMKTHNELTGIGHGSPFIYSPIYAKQKQNQSGGKINFFWVEGNVCEVSLHVCNPMPYELKVSNMCLITDGVEFESYPANLSLPAESGPYPVKILGSPKGSGDLNIIGYSTSVLGIKSHCLLSDIEHLADSICTIQVVSSLPQIQVSTSLPKMSSFSSLGAGANIVTSCALTMLAGEIKECEITLKNCGHSSVDRVDFSLDSKLAPDSVSKMFVIDQEYVDSQLPLSPGCSATFSVKIQGVSDFLPPEKSIYDDTFTYVSPLHSRGPKIVTSNVGDKLSPETPTEEACSRNIEALLQIQYSGGPGLKENFCRQCAIAFTIEVQPSFVFKRWNVMPADKPDHCFLVLDVHNTTNNEATVFYGENNTIILASRQCKRIAILAQRCSNLPLLEAYKDQQYLRYKMEELALLYSDHLSQFVDVRWSMASNKAEGKLCVDKLTWSLAQMKIIRKSPVTWELCIQGKMYLPDYVVKCSAGEILHIDMTISNLGNNDIKECLLSLQCYQDQRNGNMMDDIEDFVAVLGEDCKQIQTIPSLSKFQHECQLLFCLPGSYKLDVRCTSESTDDDDDDDNLADNPIDGEWRYSTVLIRVSESESDA